MTLARAPRRGLRVTLVPLIDVLFILLVYFMVTSVYLDLDMIPVSTAPGLAAAGSGQQVRPATALLVRIDADGGVILRGERLPPDGLLTVLRAEASRDPMPAIVLLPSPRTSLQALVTALDIVAAAGIRQSRILRLQDTP